MSNLAAYTSILSEIKTFSNRNLKLKEKCFTESVRVDSQVSDIGAWQYTPAELRVILHLIVSNQACFNWNVRKSNNILITFTMNLSLCAQ